MDENATRDIVQRFRFDRFRAEEEEWEYICSGSIETELALHRLLDGENAADIGGTYSSQRSDQKRLGF